MALTCELSGTPLPCNKSVRFQIISITSLVLGLPPREIVILSKRKLSFSVLALGLRGVPIGIHDLTQSFLDVEDDRRVRFSTVAAFKGLEAEAIIYADIDDVSSDIARELLYVGTSRARTLLAVFLSDAVRDAYSAAALRYGELLAQDA